MNKKLFGTLLLGSLLLGGTFVSCKDYDDDIENLQSQVDALKSSAALKTDVDGLKSSLEGAISAAQNAATAAKSAADAADKKASEATSELAKKAAQADLEAAQAKLAAAEDKLAKLEAAIAELNGLEAKLTEATAAEFEALKKELNGEFADIKASVEAMLESFNIHSLSLAVKDNNIIANGDMLHWGVAATDIEWAGPKGNISEGDLLIGLIQKTQGLKVVPATVDLEGANIELVNSVGETAPVSITATPASKSNAGVIINPSSRAADIQGKWNLAVEPSGVDATTIANAYAANNGKNNVRYAISVDGRVLTGYDYEVNVEKAACQDKCTAKDVWDGNKLEVVESQKMNAGTANVYQVTNSKIYDSYLTFDGNDAERAEDLGITVEGMTVVIPDGLTSRYDLYATLHVIDLTGKITEERGKLVQVDRDENTDIVKAVTITPSLLKKVEIPIGTVLKNLSDTDAKQVSAIVVSGKDKKKPFVYADKDNKVAKVGLLNSYGTEITGDASSATFDVRTVRTLFIDPADAATKLNPASVAGADTLKVDLIGNEKTGDIIKTIYVPVNVVKPSASDLAAELKVAGSWNGDVLNLKFDDSDILATDVFYDNAAIYTTRLANVDGEYEPTVVGKEFKLTQVAAVAGPPAVPAKLALAAYTIPTIPATTGALMYAKVSNTNPALEWKVKTGSITIKLAAATYWTFTYDFTINMVDVLAGAQIKWVKADANGNPTVATAGVLKKTEGKMEVYAPAAGGVALTPGLAWVYQNAKGENVYDPITRVTPSVVAALPAYPTVAARPMLIDPYETFAVAVAAGNATYNTDGYWQKTTGAVDYTFGDITTRETTATVKFPYVTTWGYDRTYTLSFEIE